MNSEKTNWKWGKEAKLKLNALSESSARANALVSDQLRNLARRMLQSKKEKFKANPLYEPDLEKSIGKYISFILVDLGYFIFPESKKVQSLIEGADIQISQENIRAAKEITAENKIKNLIPFMEPNEILNLIKDLRENTPLTEIAAKLHSLRPSLPLGKGIPIVIPEGELVQFLCPNCKGLVYAPFSEKPRTLTCLSCRHKFDSNKTTITLTNPHTLEKKQ